MLSFCKSQPVSSLNSIYLILKGLWEQLEWGWGYYCMLPTQWETWGFVLSMKSTVFLQVKFRFVWLGAISLLGMHFPVCYLLCFVLLLEPFETFEKVFKEPELQNLNAFSCLDRSFDCPIICVILEKKS